MRVLLQKNKTDEDFERRVTVITNKLMEDMKNKLDHKHITPQHIKDIQINV